MDVFKGGILITASKLDGVESRVLNLLIVERCIRRLSKGLIALRIFEIVDDCMSSKLDQCKTHGYGPLFKVSASTSSLLTSTRFLIWGQFCLSETVNILESHWKLGSIGKILDSKIPP